MSARWLSQGPLLVCIKDREIEKSIKWNFVCYSMLLTMLSAVSLAYSKAIFRELTQRACSKIRDLEI